MEKIQWRKIILEACVPVIVGLIFNIIIQCFTTESLFINISASTEQNGNFLTIINIQNLEASTLSDLSLYVDSNNEVLNIQPNDKINLQQQYIELEKISPKSEQTIALLTKHPITNKQITAEGNYKIRVVYSKYSKSPIIQAIISFGISSIAIILGSIFILWYSNKKHLQVEQEIKKLKIEQENSIKKIKSLQNDANRLQDKANRLQSETRFYNSTRISDLKKELSFWRDTVRKILYNSQNEYQTADKVIETVTSTLQTYTTREPKRHDIDELFYLTQLISDSRELHNQNDDISS